MRRRERNRRMSMVLDHLARHAGSDLSATEIGEATGLGDAALPLLADLARRGLVQHSWQRVDGQPCLCYRIADEARGGSDDD